MNQAQMSCVQAAHGRNETNSYSLALPAFGQTLHGARRFHNSHGGKLVLPIQIINLIVLRVSQAAAQRGLEL
jgi:hypothetical protein